MMSVVVLRLAADSASAPACRADQDAASEYCAEDRRLNMAHVLMTEIVPVPTRRASRRLRTHRAEAMRSMMTPMCRSTLSTHAQ